MKRTHFESRSRQEKLREKSTQYKNVKVDINTVDRLGCYTLRTHLPLKDKKDNFKT